MTTSELIAKLKELDPSGNLPVLIWEEEYAYAFEFTPETLEVKSFSKYENVYFLKYPATSEKYVLIG